MSGLVLKLGPNERVMVNGALIENGDRRCRLSILTPGVNILRMRDAIAEEAATTPARQACFAVQKVLAGDCDAEAAYPHLLSQLETLKAVFKEEAAIALVADARVHLSQQQHYKCLKVLRSLVQLEDNMMEMNE